MPVATKRALLCFSLLLFGLSAAIIAQDEPSSVPDSSDASATRHRTTVAEAEAARQKSWRKPWIPKPSEVESITAEAYCHPLPIMEVPPFVVPKKYYEELLKHFREAEPDKIAYVESQELGTMRIRFVGGSSIRICWFHAGHKNRLCFSWCGMRYRAVGPRFSDDETLEVDAIVRRIHSIEVLHEDGRSTPLVLPPQSTLVQ